MATVYKRGETYYAKFTDRNGTRTSKNTGTGRRREAERIAQEMEVKERDQHGKDSALPKALAVIVEAAAREAAAEGLTLARAQDFITRIHRVVNPSFRVVSLEDFFSGWIADQKVSDSTANNYRCALSTFKAALGPKAMAAPVGDLTEDQVRRAVDKATTKQVMRGTEERTETRAASTVNLHLATLRAVLAAAVARGLATTNGAKLVRRLNTAETTVPRAPFTTAEVRKLIDKAETSFKRAGTADEWKGAITIAAHTGLRMADVVGLGSDNIEGDRIVIIPAKTSRTEKVVQVPITPLVHSWIGDRKGAFFPKLSAMSKPCLSMAFRNLMKQADVPHIVTLPGKVKASRSFPALRHSFITWLQEADVHGDIRQRLAGHADSVVHQIYSHPDESMKRAMGTLPAF